MTRVLILREAQEDLRAAARHYEAEQRGLGHALINEVDVPTAASPSNAMHLDANAGYPGPNGAAVSPRCQPAS